MRIAVVSDVHGNLPALEAVIADLRDAAPDLVVHGGDLVAGGARPAEVIDLVRTLRWPGVYGNGEEMLWRPERVSQQLADPALQRIRDLVLNEMRPETIRAIGEDRLAWLRALPLQWSGEDVTIVHAGSDDAWNSPMVNATDEELERAYGRLATRTVVYGHIHQPYVRRLAGFTVANSGSVSLSYDGDPRASYALVDDHRVTIRRVEYDVNAEITQLFAVRYPRAKWFADILRQAAPLPMPADE